MANTTDMIIWKIQLKVANPEYASKKERRALSNPIYVIATSASEAVDLVERTEYVRPGYSEVAGVERVGPLTTPPADRSWEDGVRDLDDAGAIRIGHPSHHREGLNLDVLSVDLGAAESVLPEAAEMAAGLRERGNDEKVASVRLPLSNLIKRWPHRFGGNTERRTGRVAFRSCD